MGLVNWMQRRVVEHELTEHRQGENREAVAILTSVLDSYALSDRITAQALLSRGSARSRMGDTEGAVADWREVVYDIPSTSDVVARAHLLLGQALLKGEPAKALGHLDEALRDEVGLFKEERGKARLYRGRARASVGQWREAKADLQCLAETDFFNGVPGLLALRRAAREDLKVVNAKLGNCDA